MHNQETALVTEAVESNHSKSSPCVAVELLRLSRRIDLSKTRFDRERITARSLPDMIKIFNEREQGQRLLAGEPRKPNTIPFYGGYLEERAWYSRAQLFFDRGTVRSIHLGVDLWVPARTPIYAPLSGTVHSFRDNAATGDYGPTIVIALREPYLGARFLLLGHLARSSLFNLEVGMLVHAGERIACVGDVHENGEWPPHVHIQLIESMGAYFGDFPGVCTKHDVSEFSACCPDPTSFITDHF